MKKSIFLALLLSAGILMTAGTVKADDCNGQYGQYGGCPPTQSIRVDKTVGKPVNNGNSLEYVDNLSTADYVFGANGTVMFQIKVKNTSNTTLYNVKVVDTIPAYIEPVEGPGSYDSGSRTITFYAGDFAPDQEKVYYVKVQVWAKDRLPVGGACMTNIVNVSTDRASDQDTAQFCVAAGQSTVPVRQVVGVTQVPSTGPENGVALMITYLSILGAGFVLKKRLA